MAEGAVRVSWWRGEERSNAIFLLESCLTSRLVVFGYVFSNEMRGVRSFDFMSGIATF